MSSLLGVAFVGLLASGAMATTSATSVDLSNEVLAQVPVPDLAAVPLGLTNGPLNQSNVSLFGPGSNVVAQHLANGDITGFVRLFDHYPPNGSAVVIAATRFRDPNNLPGFLAGFDHAGATHGSPFTVAGVTGASGYETTTTANGTPVRSYEIAFSRGDTAFVIVTVTNGLLGTDAAIAVASAQAAVAPGPPAVAAAPSDQYSLEYKAGEVFGAALLAALVIGAMVIVIRKSAGGKPVQTVAVVPSPSGTVVSVPTRPPEVGWHQNGKNFNEQVYWDGQAWTAQRHWIGAQWFEGPVQPPS